MKFFEKFPLVWHQLIDCQQDDQVLLQNLSHRVMIIQKIKDIEGLLLPYNIYDGETPRSFAERVYGSFELFWIPCMINSIMDINNDWPKPEQRIVEELIAQYGLDGMWDIKYYVDQFGHETDARAIRMAYGLDGMDDSQIIANYGLTGISYHDDAINKNQAKRAIQVLDPDYVSMFVSQLEQELSK
ncbi:baseplate wedge subunit [Klebsiella phage vB_KqM-Bilbo]|uniref:Putative baseplate wedge subunit n=1 Tax=Escherichia phage vB_EcoM_KWBSE43-6 TaxID=2508194 RepID=A0A482MYY7_9CAUD|nr:baseplate wedge subunit [Escherichia phage vB_EcoM_KWBSE43-6]QBQ78896.1 putative baseplate wedge subunit [Escherichia phage vB_EcoM_KWBSE43-6]CAD5240845.1 baseplate wedge subunit [Klebsiella phage vB_KqM-Bilbo]CAD5240951.1 baseplate wedge subunit [Klebsiella phage vB_KqM-LilBean]